VVVSWAWVGEIYSCSSSESDDGGTDGGGGGDVPRGVRASYTNGRVLWAGGRRPWAGLAKLGGVRVGALKLGAGERA
jgi:hypothetical protein